MSVRTFFMFTAGLASPVLVPAGTRAALTAHVERVESVLGIVRTKFESNPTHWDRADRSVATSPIKDDLLCDTVEEHNRWVRNTYRQFEKWLASPVVDGELLTPVDAELFWFGLEELEVPVTRWTRAFYVERMNQVYDVLRGLESEEGERLEAPKLTPKQAAAVINVFSGYLDTYDMRLDVPDGHDYLASSYDGGYDWCGTCYKAIARDDPRQWNCKRRKCEVREEES